MLTSCCAAWFLTGHGLVPVRGPGTGDPCSRALRGLKIEPCITSRHFSILPIHIQNGRYHGAQNPHANAGDSEDMGSMPGLGRSPGEGNGYPGQYSCLENCMDRGAWQVAVHAEVDTLARAHTCAHTHAHTHTRTQTVTFTLPHASLRPQSSPPSSVGSWVPSLTESPGRQCIPSSFSGFLELTVCFGFSGGSFSALAPRTAE